MATEGRFFSDLFGAIRALLHQMLPRAGSRTQALAKLQRIPGTLRFTPVEVIERENVSAGGAALSILGILGYTAAVVLFALGRPKPAPTEDEILERYAPT
jgi:hypothetical protein